jgi:hypothetical protein
MSIAVDELIEILKQYEGEGCTLSACNCAEELIIDDKNFHPIRKIPITDQMRQKERELYGPQSY